MKDKYTESFEDCFVSHVESRYKYRADTLLANYKQVAKLLEERNPTSEETSRAKE